MIIVSFNHCKHKINRVLALLIWMGSMKTAGAQQFINPHFSHFTINDGLSQNLVYTITQDKQGFMWFGTKDGLNRFDGYEFRIYHHNPFDKTSLSDNAVSALFTDSKGRLWIGTANGRLDLYDRNNDRFHHFLTRDANGENIDEITEDSLGHLWVGTYGNGLFELVFDSGQTKTTTDTIIHFVHKRGDSLSIHDNFIFGVYADRGGKIWVSSMGGTFQFADIGNPANGFHTPEYTLLHAHRKIIPGGIQFDLANADTEPGENFEGKGCHFVEDSLGRLWISSSGGLLLLDQKNKRLIDFNPLTPEINQGNIISICKVSSGSGTKNLSLWLGLYGGLAIFNTHNLSLQIIKNQPGKSESLLPGNILSVYEDRSGCIWLGSNGFGLDKFSTRSALFPLPEYHSSDGNTRTENISVRSFFDAGNELLIGATDGLWKADKTNRTMYKVFLSNQFPHSNLVYSIVPADTGSCWLASNSGLVLYNLHSDKTSFFLPDISGNGQTDNRIFKLYNDGHGNLWCLTAYTFSVFNTAKKTFRHYFYNHRQVNGFSEPTYGDICQDQKGNFWLGTGEGLLYFDTAKKIFRQYTTNLSDPFSLSYNAVRCVLPDPGYPKKYLWIGTAGGGLNKFDLQTHRFTHYTVREGLPNNVVYGILPDKEGNLWLSTNKGIARFDPSTGKFHNYNVESGLQSNEFNSGAFYKNKAGELFFGGITGFNAFFPEKIKSNSYVPQVVFTGLRLLNHPVAINEKEGPLKQSISKTQKITLSYKDDNISFQVAGLDYSNPDKIQYAYKLDHFNPDWVQMGNNRVITFSNLEPGRYTLHVRAANSDGVWNKKGISLQLVILPPWWKTWWAYLIYILVFLIALYYFRKYDLKRIRLQDSLRIEHIEAEKLKELDHLKSRFFANISHEFRTPLTLIIDPLEDVMQGGNPEKLTSLLPEMHRNSKRLLQLINQLLDISRLDSKNYHIRTTREDIIPFVRQIVHSFSSLAERRNISLETEVDSMLRNKLQNSNAVFYFDEDVIEKVLTNLFPNAFKFTPDGGEIFVSLGLHENKQAFLELKVEDNGTGIPTGKLPYIFDRFYQADHSIRRQHEGSGIGLSLVKELIELHHGKISVTSRPEKGTVFTCLFPLNEKIISHPEEAGQNAPVVPDHAAPKTLPDQERNNLPLQQAGDKPLILIVEDHLDVRKYIMKKLEGTYALSEARNGKEGLGKAMEKIPDLIISDVMMPEMDGFALCKALKADDRTCHIPVILLTARAEDSDKMTGLETGADAYLIKPFNAKELLIRVSHLIALRSRMRAKFSGRLVIRPGEIAVTSRDREFMQKLTAAVENHIDDARFSVEQLAELMNMSPSQIYRKLKALIDQAPQQFIRSIRMQRALDLLKKDAGDIGEIAFRVGFENPGYFTKVFKKHFGCLPSEKEKFPE